MNVVVHSLRNLPYVAATFLMVIAAVSGSSACATGITVNWMQVNSGTIQGIYSGTMPVPPNAPYGAGIGGSYVQSDRFYGVLGSANTFSIAVATSGSWTGALSGVNAVSGGGGLIVSSTGDKFGYLYDPAGTNDALWGPLGWTLGQAISGTMTITGASVSLQSIGATGFSAASPLVVLRDQNNVPMVTYVPEPAGGAPLAIGLGTAALLVSRRRRSD